MWSTNEGVPQMPAGARSRSRSWWRAVLPDETGTTVIPIRSAPRRRAAGPRPRRAARGGRLRARPPSRSSRGAVRAGVGRARRARASRPRRSRSRPARGRRVRRVDTPVLAEPDRLALDQERQARVERPRARVFVLAEQSGARLGVARDVQPTAERGHDLERRLEPLSRAPERRRLLLRDLGLDAPVGLPRAAHRSGDRAAGTIGGWPETRRDPAPFLMSLLIPRRLT